MLLLPSVVPLIEEYGVDVVTYAVRTTIDDARAAALEEKADVPATDALVQTVRDRVTNICGRPLKAVVNATGVILHTNLGRAPLGKTVIEDISKAAEGYTNIEFDLKAASRGKRTSLARDILRYLTGAEDILVVNNNAAGLMLALKTMAEGKEVLISRGELIEIGGAFRLPDIMAASGATMVEVGTTNRTRISDYENAITENTALILKAHKSNYAVSGFTAEASIGELAGLARDRGIHFLYDIGSGLLRKPSGLALADEPDVRTSLTDGADVVAFSCDKLLGGPQAGVLAGKTELIRCMAEAPMMRALRVGKLTFAALGSACRQYLNDDSLKANNPTFAMLELTPKQLKKRARKLFARLDRSGIAASVVDSQGQCGGGTLPDRQTESCAVEIAESNGKGDGKHTFAEVLHAELLNGDIPVLGVLREGRLLLDVLTITDDQIPAVADAVVEAIGRMADG